MKRLTFNTTPITLCEEALCTKISAVPVDSDRLPLYLSGRYDILSCQTEHGQAFALFSPKRQSSLMVRQIIANANWIHQVLTLPAIFVADSLERYKRARLRQQRFNFIIANTETHLPDWSVQRTEYAPEPKKIREGLGLSAQRLLLAYLNHLFTTSITLASVKELFGFSKVTTIAAFDELENTGLARRESLPGTRGQQLLFNESGRALWDKAMPLLKTPVRAKIGIDELPPRFQKIESGETALSSLSMLNPPEQSVFAFYGSANEVASLKRESVPIEDGRYLIELWKHPPLLPGLEKLDPLTTIITTFDIANDPRVEGEHEDILEKFKW